MSLKPVTLNINIAAVEQLEERLAAIACVAMHDGVPDHGFSIKVGFEAKDGAAWVTLDPPLFAVLREGLALAAASLRPRETAAQESQP